MNLHHTFIAFPIHSLLFIIIHYSILCIYYIEYIYVKREDRERESEYLYTFATFPHVLYSLSLLNCRCLDLVSK